MIDLLRDYVPAMGAAGVATLLLMTANLWQRRTSLESSANSSISFQLIRLLLLAVATVVVILLLPISDETQGQVLSLLSVVLTAVIALSSTTFVANMMAGLMLQTSNTIRPGDYIRVADQFGRVTRRSLIHTQIQTEMRDITTLPNILLINNPVTVSHRNGTIISAELSLGYDIPYTRVEELLQMAGREAGLEDPFVLMQELLDHAIVYRVAGFLPETRHLLTARSNLRKKAVEVLHGHDVEIVSPSFMNQRPMAPDSKALPDSPVRFHGKPTKASGRVPEERIFDKAEQAATLEELKVELEQVRESLKALRSQGRGTSDQEQARLDARVEEAESREAWLLESIERLQS
jgi:small-conductance mechanosensitive channel